MDKDLYKLEVLSLVQRVAQEIFNFTGKSTALSRCKLRPSFTRTHSSSFLSFSSSVAINDKSLAEFVISLHGDSKGDLALFKKKLNDIGAGFQESFIENIKSVRPHRSLSTTSPPSSHPTRLTMLISPLYSSPPAESSSLSIPSTRRSARLL